MHIGPLLCGCYYVHEVVYTEYLHWPLALWLLLHEVVYTEYIHVRTCKLVSGVHIQSPPPHPHPHTAMYVYAGPDGVKIVGELYSVTGSDLQSGAVSVQLYNSAVVSGRRVEGVWEGRGEGEGEGRGRGRGREE